MSESAALGDFLDKWRTRWPEWRVADVFVPIAQRESAVAWFCLLQEWTEAAWGGEDPTPGLAKLGWWQEELHGWSKGARRHPLGEILQRFDADWRALSAGLGSLQASHEASRRTDASTALAAQLQPFASAASACEANLFAGAALSAADLVVPLYGEHLLRRSGDAALAQALLAQWPQGRVSRPRRLHDALLHARLQRLAAGKAAAAPSPWRTLMRSWRAARG